MSLLDKAQLLKEDIIANRRYIHQIAEVGQSLPLTSTYVMEKLKEMGYDPKLIADSSIVAVAGGKTSGKTFLIRADMDALPMREETDLSFKATNGNMHSCGHDTHTAMLLGAAKLLKDNEEDICGTIKLMFQPDEEGGTGAKSMINAGVLDNPSVDAAMMIHISGLPFHPSQQAGAIGVLLNHGRMASSDRFKIVVSGKGGHGAMPETTIDPINIAMHIGLALQTIQARELSGSDVSVLTLGKFIAGDAPNIIPDKAVLEGTIRTVDKAIREKVNKRLVEISQATANVFGGTAKVSITMAVAPLISSIPLVDELGEYIKQIYPENNLQIVNQNIMGSEDFSEVCDRVPGTVVVISAPTIGGPHLPQHHPKVEFNEDALPVGAAIYAHCAIEWLKHNR